MRGRLRGLAGFALRRALLRLFGLLPICALAAGLALAHTVHASAPGIGAIRQVGLPGFALGRGPDAPPAPPRSGQGISIGVSTPEAGTNGSAENGVSENRPPNGADENGSDGENGSDDPGEDDPNADDPPNGADDDPPYDEGDDPPCDCDDPTICCEIPVLPPGWATVTEQDGALVIQVGETVIIICPNQPMLCENAAFDSILMQLRPGDLVRVADGRVAEITPQGDMEISLLPDDALLQYPAPGIIINIPCGHTLALDVPALPSAPAQPIDLRRITFAGSGDGSLVLHKNPAASVRVGIGGRLTVDVYPQTPSWNGSIHLALADGAAVTMTSATFHQRMLRVSTVSGSAVVAAGNMHITSANPDIITEFQYDPAQGQFFANIITTALPLPFNRLQFTVSAGDDAWLQIRECGSAVHFGGFVGGQLAWGWSGLHIYSDFAFLLANIQPSVTVNFPEPAHLEY